ncbi:MAG: pyruvate ferredoxin oxidoreductase [Planctomycetota bacterium]|jgi:pyruvate ferredoxin oxidoreductase alpha subunit
MAGVAVEDKKTALRVALTGNDAAAEAFRQVDPDVAAVFPITPQTELMHKFAEFVANGKVSTLLVNVESEHSAMSAVVGAQAAGARAITATSAAGFALMYEVVNIASGLRLPTVMVVVNRAINSPLNIHCDHSDTVSARDCGWLQLYSENAQEAYDNVIQAFRIAEHADIQLPVMVTLDGFIISHTQETLELIEDEPVKKFVGEYKPEHYLLNANEPMTLGCIDLQDWLFEHKRANIDATEKSSKVILDVAKEFEGISGRSYGLIEAYRTEDAEVVALVLGSTAGTLKETVDIAREKGRKVGAIKVRSYRPFPAAEIVAAMPKAKAVAVMDRSIAYGLGGGPVFHEVRSAAYEAGMNVPMVSFVYGIGGRDIDTEICMDVFDQMQRVASSGKVGVRDRYLNLRG